MRMDLSDLPPRYRAQAERQMAAKVKKSKDPLAAAVRQAKEAGHDLDSKGEWDYYNGTVLPKMVKGEVRRCDIHPRFELYAERVYGGLVLGAIHYTPDFRVIYADGTVEIVEIKSKFVRRMQRDYPVRRRLFIEKIAEPQGWKFTEIITADSAGEEKRWRELAKEVQK